jgi:hypothetical protein
MNALLHIISSNGQGLLADVLSKRGVKGVFWGRK